jgi:hypothetical protein
LKRRAFAIVYQMLVSVIVLLLVGAILITSRYQVFAARGELFSVRAQYAAEAGLSWVIGQLSRNPAWQGNLTREPVPGDTATFTVRFRSPLLAGSLDSVNNLSNGSAVRSYLGADTVPPRCAFVVVVGEANGHRQELEAFVTGGGSWSQGAALLASDTIFLNRNVFVDGYKSLRGTQSVPGSIHSNKATGQAIRWSVPADGQAYALEVSGQLTSVSSDPQAIQLDGVTSVSRKEDAPHRKLPHIDVASLVQRYSGTTGGPLAGNPVVLNGGDHFYSNDNMVINGDVELQNGARLVVSGNLTINGSVGGHGAILVDGDTKLFGDSSVIGDETEYVSLLASGHVQISGFDGTAYLESLAASQPASTPTRGDEAGELWHDIKKEVRWVRNWMVQNPTPTAATWSDSPVDNHLAVLGQGDSDWGSGSGPWVVSSHVGPPYPRRNSTALMANKITGGGPTQAFLRERFRHLDDLFRSSSYTRSGDTGLSGGAKANRNKQDMLNYLNGTGDPATFGGLIDLAQSAWYVFDDTNGGGGYGSWAGATMTRLTNELIPDLSRQVDMLNYDRLGAAQFRGLVYAHGGIVADHEVTVIGSMIADGDPARGSKLVDGISVTPGQIHLQGNSRFTYVKDMFEDGVRNLIDLGVLDVKGWRLRN